MAPSPTADIICLIHQPDPRFLERQLRSIQDQTAASWRCHLHDDASDDLSAVRQLIAGDDRFVLHDHADRRGVVGNADRAIGLLPQDADIIFFADQDDVWRPDKVERIRGSFDANPHWQLVHSDMALIDETDAVVHPSCFAFQRRSVGDMGPQALLIRSTVTGCAMAVRAGLLHRATPLPVTAEPRIYHDRWIALIAALSGAIGVLREPLTQYRQHGGNQIGAVSPSERGRAVRRAPRQSLSAAWAERRAVLDALDHWRRSADLSQSERSTVQQLLAWRGRWDRGLWRYGLTARSRPWVNRRAALGLAIGRLFASPGG